MIRVKLVGEKAINRRLHKLVKKDAARALRRSFAEGTKIVQAAMVQTAPKSKEGARHRKRPGYVPYWHAIRSIRRTYQGGTIIFAASGVRYTNRVDGQGGGNLAHLLEYGSFTRYWKKPRQDGSRRTTGRMPFPRVGPIRRAWDMSEQRANAAILKKLQRLIFGK